MFKMINEINEALDNNAKFRDYAYKTGKQNILMTVFVWLPFYALILAYMLGERASKKKEETKSSTEPEKEQ